MRANEFLVESPESELADKLPTLDKHDYDTIDRLMKRICKKHGISGQKLHDLFVDKYNKTPDTYAKNLDEASLAQMRKDLAQMDKTNIVQRKVYHGFDDYEKEKEKQQKLDKEREETKRVRTPIKPWPMQMRESVELSDQERDAHIYEFIEWCYKLLNIQNPPKFELSYDTEEAQVNHHTGRHSGNNIWVYVKNRNLIDILRTILHELTHQRQYELGMIKPDDSYPGSPIEMLADMVAGKYIKVWGKKHPEIFQ
jgi:hypothetical protein